MARATAKLQVVRPPARALKATGVRGAALAADGGSGNIMRGMSILSMNNPRKGR